MARTHLQDIRGLPDPLLSYNFDLVIRPKGGGDGRPLTVKCQSTSIPGMQIESVTVALKGAEVKYAGRRMFTKTLEASIIETRDMSTYNALQSWFNAARNPVANTGGYKADYSSVVELVLYDDIPSVVKTFKLFGVYPETLSDAALESSSSTVVAYSLTLSYDFFE